MTDYFLIRLSVIGLALLFASGCDGGIFGTGDGEDPTVIVPGDTTEDGNMDMPVTDPVDQTPGPTQVSFVTANSTGSFNNNQITSDRSDAQIKLVNASPDQNLSVVAINNNMVEMPLIPLPGLTPFVRDSGYLTLSNPANAIEIFTSIDAVEEDFMSPIVAFNPITLSAGSASTLILRGIPGSAETPLELFAVGNQTQTMDETALVRVVHAVTRLKESVNISLKPTASEASNEVTIDTDLNYGRGITDYKAVLPGNYELIARGTTDTAIVATESETISLAPNDVVTLILLDNDDIDSESITVLRSRDSGL